MQYTMKLSQLANIVDGKYQGEDCTFTHVNTDTRSIQAGDVFFALKGENFDAHDFIAKAREQGAVAAVVNREIHDPLPQIFVTDTLKAFGAYAKWHRNQYSPIVLGVTGSNGKTTTKEMLASILSQCGNVLASKGNFNNDVGVPLTLLQITDQHRFAVIEMGANHLGEIAYVASLASPQIAIITNVAPAHLAGFGSVEGVAKEKGEIYRALPVNGTAVINADDQFADRWIASLNGQRVLRFSFDKCINPANDFYASQLSHNDEGYYSFCLHCPLGDTPITLLIPGKHMVANALAASAAAYAAGASLADIRAGLEQVKPVIGRMCSRPGINGARIIDDTYNANPGSVKAAIELLMQVNGQPLLVLGDIGELGEGAQQYHRWIGEQAKALGIKQFYAWGTLSELAITAFGKDGKHFSDKSALIEAIRETLTPDRVVLVKGSRSSKMEQVVNALVEQ